MALHLEIWINGVSTELIAEVLERSQGGFLIRSSELKSLGLQPTPSRGGVNDPELRLDTLPGVSVRYDAPAQRLYVTAADKALIPVVLRARFSASETNSASPSDVGALLDYSLVTGASQGSRGEPWSAQGLGGEFEGRLFGRLGLLTTSFTAQAWSGPARATRLDSTWSWSDPATLDMFSAGDLINGGFTWTRPVRLGGFQLRRDFSLRPDLITMPSPHLSASAAVPSLADVLMNGVAVDSEAVKGGPLQVQDLPVVDGVNRTTLVLRDTLGRQTTYSSSFFVTPDLLKPGLVDFSLEAGFPRRDYGERSFDYQGDPALSASLREGLSDGLTVDLHGEANPHLATAGGAGVVRLGGAGVVSASLAASAYHGQFGAQVGGTFRAQLGPVALDGAAQQSVGAYYDLGAVSGPKGIDPRALAAPRQLVQAGLSAPLPFLPVVTETQSRPYLAVDLSSVTPALGSSRTILNADLRKGFAYGVEVFLNVYDDLRQSSGGLGGFLGISMPFGLGGAADAGVQSMSGRASAFMEASEQGGLEPGSLSWRLRAAAGNGSNLEGEAAYRSGVGLADVRMQALNGAGAVQASLNGSLVAMDRQVFAADHIDGAFAVVDTGVAHVPVTFENRPIGSTDLRGRILVPYLTAYERNVIGIDSDALPADLVTRTTRQVVSPARGAGVVVRFVLRPAIQGAVVVLQDSKGSPLPVGAQGHITSDGDAFVVGYDGLAYLEGAAPGAPIEVRFADGHACTATVPAASRSRQSLRCL